MPTALKLAGAEVGDDIDFQDLRPHWEGKGRPRDAAIGAYMDLQRMIEKDGKKLILYPKAKVARVFDLQADPAEKNDLAGTPAGQALAVPLLQRLLEIQKESGDPLDLAGTFPDLTAAGDGEKTR